MSGSREPRAAQRSPRWTRRAFSLLWAPLAWAIPFGVFFGTLSGGRWSAYRDAYVISLVFSYVIRLTVFMVERLILPRMRFAAPPGRYPWIREAGLMLVATMLASYLAAYIVHVFIMPGFLGSPRAWAVSGMFALAFSLLVGGMVYARVFYRVSLERSAQVERIRGELARAELRALRAQINPHFLFNTLNTIAALIAEDPNAAEDIVTRLADVFRYALTSANREHARFGDELDFLRAYLEIERTRLGARLRIEEDIAPGLEGIPVPSLLFQPLVENAVRYGVASRPEGGTVRIEARRDEGRLVVRILDDGPGFAAESGPAGHGIGLESVRERLRLAGAGHALEIDSPPAGGARVTVTLPVEPPVVAPGESASLPACGERYA